MEEADQDASAVTLAISSEIFSPKLANAVARIYKVDPLCDPRWKALVENHPQASLFHSTNWLKALKITYEYDPLVITTCPPEDPLTNGLVFCCIKSWLTGRRMVSLPFSDHCEPLISNTHELDEMLAHAGNSVDNREWKSIEIRPIICRPGGCTGFREADAYYLHRLDLRRSLAELFHDFHKDCVQRKIRRAEREKLEYEEGTSEALLQSFYRLLVMTRRRHYLPPQPLLWFRELIAAFGENLKIRVTYKDRLPIASVLTISYKKCMVYKYGCSNTRFNKLGGMAILLWQAMQDAKDNGLEELDMGRSDIDDVGLIAFKQHWGAVGIPISYWTYPPRSLNPLNSWGKRVVRRTLSATPDATLKTVGNFFYKHVG
jgi:GNAT acetyltransferase-like protein